LAGAVDCPRGRRNANAGRHCNLLKSDLPAHEYISPLKDRDIFADRFQCLRLVSTAAKKWTEKFFSTVWWSAEKSCFHF
jgi:hypothetical protein